MVTNEGNVASAGGGCKGGAKQISRLRTILRIDPDILHDSRVARLDDASFVALIIMWSRHGAGKRFVTWAQVASSFRGQKDAADRGVPLLEQLGFVEYFRSGLRLLPIEAVTGQPMLSLCREDWSSDAYAAVLNRDGMVCRYCGQHINAGKEQIDHVHPRCQGGGDDASNLVVSCRPCNSTKSGRTPEQAGMTLLGIGGAK